MVAQAIIAGRHALLTKIMNSLLRGLASNGLESVIKIIEAFWSHSSKRSTSHRICIRFCFALFCCS